MTGTYASVYLTHIGFDLPLSGPGGGRVRHLPVPVGLIALLILGEGDRELPPSSAGATAPTL